METSVNYNGGSDTPILDAAGTPRFTWMTENPKRRARMAPIVKALADTGHVFKGDFERRQFEALASISMFETAKELNSSRNPMVKERLLRAVQTERAEASREKRLVSEAAILDMATDGVMLANLGLMGAIWSDQIISQVFATQIFSQVESSIFYRNPVTVSAQEVDGYTYPAGSAIHQNIFRTNGNFIKDYYTSTRGATIKAITNDLFKKSYLAEAVKVRYVNPVEDVTDLYSYFGTDLNSMQADDCVKHLLRIFQATCWSTALENVPAAHVVTFNPTGHTAGAYDYERFTAEQHWEERLLGKLAEIDTKIMPYSKAPANIIVGSPVGLLPFRKLARKTGNMVLNLNAEAAMVSGAEMLSGGLESGIYNGQYRVFCAYDFPTDAGVLVLHKNNADPRPFRAAGFAGIYQIGYQSPIFTNPENLTIGQAFMDRWVFDCPGETKYLMGAIQYGTE